MTRVPMGASVADGKYGFPFGPMMTGRYAERGLVPQGISAELIADKWGISPRGPRRVLGASRTSARRRATAEGRFDREIVPVDGARPTTGDETDDAPTRASAPTPRWRRWPS